MSASATLVLVDRPTSRAALVALAGAVEVWSPADAVELRLVRGAERVAEAIREAAASRRATAVAWSFFSAQAEAVARELAAVRAGAPGALHVAGGPHATAEPEATLGLGFDLVARGEGERTAAGLVRALLDGEDPRRVRGLGWLVAGQLATSGRPAAVSLDDHPGFSRRLGKASALEITRGCPWACRFCQTPFLHGSRLRHRSIASSREWVRFARHLGHRDLRFLTPSALSYGASGTEPELDAVEGLLAAVREEAGPERRIFFGTFPSELRPEHVSPRALAILRRFVDHRDLLLGAQSGSERLLAAMRRGHGVEEVERAVRLAIEAGFSPSVDVIVGLPGETEGDLAATRALAERLAAIGARVHAHAFLPLPGTPWRRAPPGRADAATDALLDRLASRGRAYGQWKRQAELGASLAAAARS